MSSLKVSIIVPIHNSEMYIARCIDSIISQNYDYLECILIENGSRDNSKRICMEYAAKSKRILFKSTTDVGVSRARNIGLSMATGDIISFCDSDDFLEPNSIVEVISEFEKNENIAAVFGGIYIGKQKKDYVAKHYKGLKDNLITTKKALQLSIVNDSVMGSVCNKYYRATLIKNIRFNEQLVLCEDMHFNSLVLSSLEPKFKVKIISRPIYCYVENDNSTTNNDKILFDEKDNSNYIIALEKIFADCNLDIKTETCLRMRIACFAIDFFMNYKLNENKRDKLYHLLRANYSCLLLNIFQNDFKMNVKKIIQGLCILLFF